MARYRKIDTRIWNDEKFNALSHHGKLFFFFLLSHPHLTALGAMRTSLSGLVGELCWKRSQLKKALAETFSKGMVRFDQKASLVWLPNFLKYNSPESPNVIKSWERTLDYLPECPLRLELVESTKNFVMQLPKSFSDSLPTIFLMADHAGQTQSENTTDIYQERCSDVITHIFETWKTTFNHLDAKLDNKRKMVISHALKSGYTSEQCCKAIQGCALTPHNMGVNACKQRYDGLGVIFKNADNIDRFIENAHNPPALPKNIHYRSKKRLTGEELYDHEYVSTESHDH